MNLSRARAMPMVNATMMPSLLKTRARARATSISHSRIMTKPKTKLHPAMPNAMTMPSLLKTRAKAASISFSRMIAKMELHHAMPNTVMMPSPLKTSAKAKVMMMPNLATISKARATSIPHSQTMMMKTKTNLYHRTTMALVNVATMLSLLETSTAAEVVAMPSLPRTSAKARTRRMLILEITLLSVAVDNMRKVSFFCQFRTQRNTN
jgi:hypothetical protein